MADREQFCFHRMLLLLTSTLNADSLNALTNEEEEIPSSSSSSNASPVSPTSSTSSEDNETPEDVGWTSAEQSYQLSSRDVVAADTADSCVICLTQFVIGEQISQLVCLHKFHHGCIIKWINKKQNCPICRTAIDGTPRTEDQQP